MKIVAVTSCPSGVAHTYMAAEALSLAARALDCEIKVETQGSIGIENALTTEEIRDADYVVLSKEVAIKDEERFEGKRIARVAIADLLKQAEAVINQLRNHYQAQVCDS